MKVYNKKESKMSISIANDIRMQYKKSFATLKGIVEAFPDEKWLVAHGDEYYIPCRIAYHLAVFIARHLCGGFLDADFTNKLPYGNWMEATAEILPSKDDFFVYLDGILVQAEDALTNITDGSLLEAVEAERTWFGESQVGVHTYCLREIAAHTGELNKMLIENGLDDIWVFR